MFSAHRETVVDQRASFPTSDSILGSTVCQRKLQVTEFISEQTQKFLKDWQIICNRDGLDYLRVAEDVWTKNIFITQRFSGKWADAKLYFEVLDPTNLESWLVFNREQNPFSGLDFSQEVPNRRYAEIAGTRAKKLSKSGRHTIKKK